MSYTTRDLQARLNSLGYDAGQVDGVWGRMSQRAFDQAEDDMGRGKVMPHHNLTRIHLHWTAGAYGDIALERRAYHLLILHDGKVVMGDYAPEANADTSDGRYAAHTKAANGRAIGVSVDAMGGAQQHPFNPGKWPITERQMDRLYVEVANLCDTYDIPVTKWSVLTHAEIQPTLGIRQRWKWDITWIPGMNKPGNPISVGNVIRKNVLKELRR